MKDHRALVAECYERLLGRAADEAGLPHYTARLADGSGRGPILDPRASHAGRAGAGGEIFSREQVRRIIDRSSLRLVQPPDDRVGNRYDTPPVDLRVDSFQSPHMLLKHDEAVFTSVFVFLEKQEKRG